MSRSRAIAVLFGGSSAEREVSIESGNAVAAALADRGHYVERLDPAVTPVTAVEWNRLEAAFIALHGTYGEDGQVQRELDAIGVRYTGSSAVASALAFDKLRAKAAFRSAGVPTPQSAAIAPGDSAETVQRLAAEIAFPVVVKPSSQGSSVGVSVVYDPEQLSAAVCECFRYDTAGLIERAVLGDEWTVGVVDGRPLVPIRIESARGFYDYEAKYQDDRTGYHLADQNTAPELIDELQRVSLHASAVLGTSGIARVDLMLDEQSRPWVLEVNTVPGFTSHSLIPKAAAAEGLTLGELCESVLPPQSSAWSGTRSA